MTHDDRKWRIGIAPLFALAIGVILLVSIGSVVAVSTLSSRTGLVEGLGEEYDFAISTIQARVDDHLGGVEETLAYLADAMVAADAAEVDDPWIETAMRFAVAGTPQISAVAFVRTDGASIQLKRGSDVSMLDDLGEQEPIRAAVRKMEMSGPDAAVEWTDPLFSSALSRSIIVRRQAVWSDGAFFGVFFAGVDLSALSRHVATLSDDLGQTVFVLQGRDGVIAHPELLRRDFGLSAAQPVAARADLDDRRLNDMWREDRKPVISIAHMERSKGHYFTDGGEWQVFIYGEMTGYGVAPWIVGYHFDGLSGAQEVWRFWTALAVSVALLMLFVSLGAWFGTRAARPLRALTTNAYAIQQLNLGRYAPLKSTRIVELDRAAKALDAMVGGLRVFQRYVPRHIVESVVRDGADDVPAQTRRITALFTDIVDFSRLAAHLSAAETAAVLNGHFALLGRAIEAEEGHIDKFAGDGLLAFWGATEKRADNAEAACRAALAIRAAIEDDNRRIRKEGGEPIRLRIGVHTGDALVGEIGTARRIEFTAIGDTLNIASRVEGEGRAYADGDVTILITEATKAALPVGAFDLEPLGRIRLRGFEETIALYRL